MRILAYFMLLSLFVPCAYAAQSPSTQPQQGHPTVNIVASRVMTTLFLGCVGGFMGAIVGSGCPFPQSGAVCAGGALLGFKLAWIMGWLEIPLSMLEALCSTSRASERFFFAGGVAAVFCSSVMGYQLLQVYNSLCSA